jgi:hypothetical protein
MGARRMKTCLYCDGKVSPAYARVYGDNNNKVHRCPSCIGSDGGKALLKRGAAAGRDIEVIKEQMTPSGRSIEQLKNL